MYSVLTHKATRGPKVVQQGLTLAAAIDTASQLYDFGRIFDAHRLLASGVCTLVMEDALATATVAAGTVPGPNETGIEFQCGGY